MIGDVLAQWLRGCGISWLEMWWVAQWLRGCGGSMVGDVVAQWLVMWWLNGW
jgi:hypothetical protein